MVWKNSAKRRCAESGSILLETKWLKEPLKKGPKWIKLCIVGLLGNRSINTLLSPSLSRLQNNPFTYMGSHFSQEVRQEAIRILGNRWGWLEGKHDHRMQWGIWNSNVPASKSCSREAAAPWVGTALMVLWNVWEVPVSVVFLLKPTISVICSFSGSGSSRCHLLLLLTWRAHRELLKPGWKLLAFCNFIWIVCWTGEKLLIWLIML